MYESEALSETKGFKDGQIVRTCSKFRASALCDVFPLVVTIQKLLVRV